MDKQVEMQLIVDDLKLQINKNKNDQDYCKLQMKNASDGVAQMLEEQLQDFQAEALRLKGELNLAEREMTQVQQEKF